LQGSCSKGSNIKEQVGTLETSVGEGAQETTPVCVRERERERETERERERERQRERENHQRKERRHSLGTGEIRKGHCAQGRNVDFYNSDAKKVSKAVIAKRHTHRRSLYSSSKQ